MAIDGVAMLAVRARARAALAMPVITRLAMVSLLCFRVSMTP
jgi:hypothetical protein